ncbi:MAG TPA: glycosyltransferase [Phycisphaerales bacterium]|nr:glycosyltransferase [Phycisphaerales bacterium]
MRILHISTRLILGGSQENTVLSCEGQARLGHDVHLAFGPIYGPEGSLLERVENFRTPEGHGITTHVVPHLVREVNPLSDWRAERELLALIRDIKPDIVHTHSSKAGILGRRAGWASRCRMTMQTYLAKGPHGEPAEVAECIAGLRPGVAHTIHGPPFMPIEGGPLKRAKVRLNNLIYTVAERHAAERCHTIVSVADAMTRQFLARGIGLPEQYVTVRSGMETAPFLHAAPGESRGEVRRELGLNDTDFVIGTVARLAEHKGHDDLLDALADDLRRNPQWKLLWVGNGWWRERLIEKTRAMGLTVTELDRASSAPTPSHRLTDSPPQVLITGLVPPQRIPALMRAMDVLAHPSYREGLPRTVPQALLAGVCPVAYDVDGTGEACREMQTGRLVPLADLEKLREAILWCAAHPQERQTLAARGQRECAELFSTERMISDLEQVYAKALNPGGAGF